MNKLLKGLLVAALAVGVANADTNKTFLMPRSAGVNLPMEYTTFNELIQHQNGDFFGAHFQVTPFYMDSTNGSDLAKYFGIQNKGKFTLGNLDAGVTAGTYDFNYRYMIHDLSGDHAGRATLNFDPELQAYGARIDYYQDLEKILDGLYLKIALPIVHTETEINRTATVETAAGTLTLANLNNYFKGAYNVAAADSNAQERLRHAKRDGSHSNTSVADIDVVLGYKIFDKEKYYFALNLGLTIPVGNDADGDWTFEPIVGNGDHWGFGGGLDAMVRLWKKNDQNIRLTLVANYRYLFEGTEKRTAGLIDPDGTTGINFGQYYLVGEHNVARNTQQLKPFANVSTVDMDVTPGSQLDAMAYFTYNNGNWTFDLGYNFFWKDDEDVKFKNEWTDNKYIVVHIAQDMNTAGVLQNSAANVAAATAGGGLGYINKAADSTALATDSATAYQADPGVAATASQDTHKIFGGIGYNFKEWEYPMLLGIGGGYEFANDNAFENWQIYGKIGVKF